MMDIKVTGSGWINGSGWRYTEDLDPMPMDEMDTDEEIKAYAAEYAATYADGKTAEDFKSEDYQLRFYRNENDEPICKFWVSSFVDGTEPKTFC